MLWVTIIIVAVVIAIATIFVAAIAKQAYSATSNYHEVTYVYACPVKDCSIQILAHNITRVEELSKNHELNHIRKNFETAYGNGEKVMILPNEEERTAEPNRSRPDSGDGVRGEVGN